ncbi:hypothetical protein BHE74_00003064 [Ensete ventricosum]|nr:hypothetical protein BHE74_00003064 [Ensete ventricosum]
MPHHSTSSSFSPNITSPEEEEEAERCDADANVSPLCLIFLLVIDVWIDINKADHRIVLANNHPWRYLPAETCKDL